MAPDSTVEHCRAQALRSKRKTHSPILRDVLYVLLNKGNPKKVAFPLVSCKLK